MIGEAQYLNLIKHILNMELRKLGEMEQLIQVLVIV